MTKNSSALLFRHGDPCSFNTNATKKIHVFSRFRRVIFFGSKKKNVKSIFKIHFKNPFF
jgi:hypothetical protein